MSPAIEVSEIQKSFRHLDALSGITLTVPSGTVFALLGENGAGKTTLIRILTGFLQADSGSARVLGMDPAKHALEIRQRIGYVADQPGLYDWMRVGEIGWFASSFYPAGFLDRFRDLMAGFEVKLIQRIRHLSKGQRAKVALGLALAHEPQLLILDEPTSGLDPLVRRQFLESMVTRAAAGRTVLLSSHQIGEVERVADWIAIIHGGKTCVVKPLDELKASVVEWLIHCDSSDIVLPETNGHVLSEVRHGRQIRMIIADPSDDDPSSLRNATGVASIEPRCMSLEDIFVAYTRSVPIARRSEKSDSCVNHPVV